MKRVVWKYAIPIEDHFALDMPLAPQFLSMQVQQGIAMLWALVDPDAARMPRYFRVLGTGHVTDDYLVGAYLGTFQVADGRLVFHLFDVGD